MNARGRTAALPAAGYRSPQRLFADEAQGTLVVRVYPESTEDRRDFDFTCFPVPAELRSWFATTFARSTGPSGTKRRAETAKTGYLHLRRFARYLGSLNQPPARPADLRPAHLDGYGLQRRGDRHWGHEIYTLRATLRMGEGAPDAFMTALETWWAPYVKGRKKDAYTKDEFRRMVSAARAEIRQAAGRIRDSAQLLGRWRAGEISRDDTSQWEKGWLLDYIDRHGDVPRYGGRHQQKAVVVRLGGAVTVMSWLYLTVHEIGAAAILLIGLTGQNLSTLDHATVTHHRPDGHTGAAATAITDMVKPRRGIRRSSMSVPLSSVPPWIGPLPEGSGASAGHGELHTPFGVYMLLAEISEAARRHAGTDRLLVSWGWKRYKGFRVGIPDESLYVWGRRHGFPAVDSLRLRATWVEIHQQPVAHTEQTLANEYLARSAGNFAEYRAVVAEVLDAEVRKARTLARVMVLTEDDRREAVFSPETVAARFDMDATTLKRVLAGELDTVLAACTDHLASPFSPPGQPCQASYMICLSCPCARATPSHLPVIIATRDELEARRAGLTPLRWAERYAGPLAQLDDVLGHYPPQTVDKERSLITGAQRALVARFLNHELDLR